MIKKTQLDTLNTCICIFTYMHAHIFTQSVMLNEGQGFKELYSLGSSLTGPWEQPWNFLSNEQKSIINLTKNHDCQRDL